MITVDMTKAKVIAHDARRAARNAAFAPLDIKECFSFGKHKGKKVTEILEKEPGYFGWLQSADFPLYTKKVLTAIKLRAFNNKLQ